MGAKMKKIKDLLMGVVLIATLYILMIMMFVLNETSGVM
jgi:hypothetical protein